jgi:L-asparaginase II
MPIPLVRVVRSGLEESVHQGDVAVADPTGTLVASAGDPSRVAFARSSMKPLQASVSLTLSSFDYSDREISVMCASHNGESVHISAVREILERTGVPESALQTPAMLPWDQDSALAAPHRLPINSDCSGKHAGMLGASKEQGWDLASYRSPDHPLQERVQRAVLAASAQREAIVGVDGCGVPVHGLPLSAMATIYARLAVADAMPAGDGELWTAAERALRAMRAKPYLVAGRNRVDTAVMDAVGGVVVKAGAEGMICAALMDRELGVAVKIHDGFHRATGPALIRALAALEVVDDAAYRTLRPYAEPDVLGGGVQVGSLRAEFDLVGG